jgi:VanZ family protein
VGLSEHGHGAWPGTLGRILAAAGLLAGMAGIYLLSEQSELPEPPLAFPGLDKLAHAVAFGVLGVLAYLALGLRQRGGRPSLGPMLLAVVIVTLYAVFDELHQSRIPGRYASFYDGVADLGGAVLGVVLVWKLYAGALRRRGGPERRGRPTA